MEGRGEEKITEENRREQKRGDEKRREEKRRENQRREVCHFDQNLDKYVERVGAREVERDNMKLEINRVLEKMRPTR